MTTKKLILTLILFVSFLQAYSVVAATLTFERISVDDLGAEADNASLSPAISSDGRYVVFSSRASNLVADDTNGTYDVFVYDREASTTERFSVSDSTVEGNGASLNPDISADGRYAVFSSAATNLVFFDFNAKTDIFFRDLQSQFTARIRSNEGDAGNSNSSGPVISDDGEYLVFASNASNLVEDDTNVCAVLGGGNCGDIFIYHMDSGLIEQRIINEDDEEGDSHSYAPAVSSDGQYIAFVSSATNFVADDENGTSDIFVFNRETGDIERVSVSDLGVEADGGSSEPSISGDGRYVTFTSDATNLVDGDINGVSDIFVYDRDTDTIELISDPSEYAYDSAISGDGRYVAFTQSSDEGMGATEGIYRYDRDTDTTLFVTEGAINEEDGAYSSSPTLSESGLTLAFVSGATDLVLNDTNEFSDVFVYTEEVEEVEEEEEEEEEDEDEDEDDDDGRSSFRQDPPESLSGGTSDTGGSDTGDARDTTAEIQALQKRIIELLTLLIQKLIEIRSQA